MKKKGFTLIELLAVIVILAIIALIAVPMVLNIIEKSKIGALKSSLTGLIESADIYYANNQLQGGNAVETIFDFEDGEQISGATLEYKGKIENGKLILHANGEVAACIDDGTYYAYKNKDANEITNGVGTCLYDGTTGDFSSNSPLDEIQSQIAQATATSSDVLEGKTLFTSSGLLSGTMVNKSGTTTAASTVTESGTDAIITIPESGYYDTTSQISVPITTIQNNVDVTNISYYTGTGANGAGTQNPTITLAKGKYIVSLTSTYAQDSGWQSYSINVTGGTYTHLKMLQTYHVASTKLTAYIDYYEVEITSDSGTVRGTINAGNSPTAGLSLLTALKIN